MVLCQDASAPLDALDSVRAELEVAGIDKRALVAVTKLDQAAPERVAEISELVGLPTIGVSILDDDSLDRFREALWQLTGLIRIYLRRPGQEDEEPNALPPDATVVDAARLVHHALAETCTGAHVTGPSAKFDHQRVGRDHVLAEGDTVEIV